LIDIETEAFVRNLPSNFIADNDKSYDHAEEDNHHTQGYEDAYNNDDMHYNYNDDDRYYSQPLDDNYHHVRQSFPCTSSLSITIVIGLLTDTFRISRSLQKRANNRITLMITGSRIRASLLTLRWLRLEKPGRRKKKSIRPIKSHMASTKPARLLM
jgi:hypothetical protein